VHGLPREQIEPVSIGWDQLIDHLRALAESGQPIRIAVSDDRTRTAPYLETSGWLRLESAPRVGPVGNHLPGALVTLLWPAHKGLGGRVALHADLFTGATLFTVDGDDYFTLTVQMGDIKIAFSDANN